MINLLDIRIADVLISGPLQIYVSTYLHGFLKYFVDLFEKTNVTAALAASVFHKKIIAIGELKKFLKENKIEVRI